MQIVHYNNICVTCMYEVVVGLSKTLIFLVEVACGFFELLKSVSAQ